MPRTRLCPRLDGETLRGGHVSTSHINFRPSTSRKLQLRAAVEIKQRAWVSFLRVPVVTACTAADVAAGMGLGQQHCRVQSSPVPGMLPSPRRAPRLPAPHCAQGDGVLCGRPPGPGFLISRCAGPFRHLLTVKDTF